MPLQTYWIYCKNGIRVDSKTLDVNKAFQIAGLYPDAMFISDRTYYWRNGDWTLES